jgi:hypothetical protein
VIAFDRAAASELIKNGENGCLIPCDQKQGEELFVTRSVELAGNQRRLLVMSHRAAQRMQGHGWEQVSDSFHQLLQASQKEEYNSRVWPASTVIQRRRTNRL